MRTQSQVPRFFRAPEVVSQTHLTAVKKLLQALYRRRLLIVLPVALLTPLVFVVSAMLPQTFVARSLLLLQETQPDSPLTREQLASIDQVSQKAPALEALLRSDYILQQVVDRWPEQASTPPASSQRQRAVLVKSLRDAISVSVIGSDFVEVRLQGASPVGLGERLNGLISVFLETMLSPPNRGNAVEFVLKSYRQQVADAIAAREAIAAELSKVAISERATSPTAIEIKLREAERLVAQRTNALEAISERYQNTSELANIGLLFQPQRIVVLDPPSDPYFAKYPRWLFVASGLAAIVLLGIGLALLAESLDPRVRELQEIEMLAAAPVVAVVASDSRGSNHTGIFFISAFVVLVTLAIGIAIAARSGVIPVDQFRQWLPSSLVEATGG